MIDLGYNERRIIEVLRTSGPMLRPRIAEITELTTATLSRLSASLIDAGLLNETDPVRSGGRGQPGRLLELAADGAFSVGIAITWESLSICLIDFLGAVRREERVVLRDLDPLAVLAIVARQLDRLLAGHPKARKRLLGVGMTLPGDFNVIEGHINPVEEFAAWAPLDIASTFSEKLNVPVWYEKDGNVAALSEAYFGVGRDFDNFALVYLSEGIGGGLIQGRRLFRGTNGNAGQFGGLYPRGRPRPSGGDLLELLAANGSDIHELETLDIERVPKDLLDEWVDQASRQLAEMFLTIFKVVDPQAIVLGGIIAKPLMDLLLAATVARQSFETEGLRREPKMLMSSLVGRGPYLGAATLPIYHLSAPSDYIGRALKGW